MAAVIINILAATIRISTPLLLSAMGELVTERSGVMNLGAFAGLAALQVRGEPTPTIGPSSGLPRTRRPGVVPDFARVGNRVEDPRALPRAHIKGADVSRRRRPPGRRLTAGARRPDR